MLAIVGRTIRLENVVGPVLDEDGLGPLRVVNCRTLDGRNRPKATNAPCVPALSPTLCILANYVGFHLHSWLICG